MCQGDGHFLPRLISWVRGAWPAATKPSQRLDIWLVTAVQLTCLSLERNKQMPRRLKNYLAIILAVLFGLVPSATEATEKFESPNILFVVADDLGWSDVGWYEGGTRVCAFANWRGKLKPQKLTVPMHAVDWMPTIAALLGYTSRVDLQWDGVNQWPVLTGAATPSLPRTIYIAAKGGHSIRSGEWKLIVPANGKAQLFHIGNDPYEKSDVVDSMPDIVTDLRNRLAAHQAKDQPHLPSDLVGLPE